MILSRFQIDIVFFNPWSQQFKKVAKNVKIASFWAFLGQCGSFLSGEVGCRVTSEHDKSENDNSVAAPNFGSIIYLNAYILIYWSWIYKYIIKSWGLFWALFNRDNLNILRLEACEEFSFEKFRLFFGRESENKKSLNLFPPSLAVLRAGPVASSATLLPPPRGVVTMLSGPFVVNVWPNKTEDGKCNRVFIFVRRMSKVWRDGAGFQNYLGWFWTPLAGCRRCPGFESRQCSGLSSARRLIFSKVCDVCALVVGVGVDEAPTQPAQLRSLV